MTLVSFFQTHDKDGRPAPAEHRVEIPTKWDMLGATAAMNYLLPFEPRLTSERDSYFFNRAGVGSGWFRIEGISEIEARHLHDLLAVEDVSLAIGINEPWREDPAIMRGAAVLRAGNPWFLIIGALVLVIVSTVPWAFLQVPMTPLLLVVMVSLMAVFFVLAAFLAIRGLMRLKWWNAARAEVRRRGIAYPPKLTGTGT